MNKSKVRSDLEVPLATASLSWPPPLVMAAPVETPVNFPRSGPSTALAEPRAREGCCVSLSSPISSLVSNPAGSPPVDHSQSLILGTPRQNYFETRFSCMHLSKLPGRMHNSFTHCAFIFKLPLQAQVYEESVANYAVNTLECRRVWKIDKQSRRCIL